MALADYLQPHERVAAECGHVAVTNLRLIHHIPRSGAPVFRELPLAAVRTLRLSQRPRSTTVVLGVLIAVLSLLAGPGTPLQLGAAGLGVIAALLGIVFGDLSVVISTDAAGAKPLRWPLREAGHREGRELVAIARAVVNGEYDFAPEPRPAAPAPAALARSVLLLPADDAAATLAALAGDADALCLDLTTLVHPSRRATARELAASAVAAAERAGVRVWVHIGLDEAEADLAACVRPGLTAVVALTASPGDAARLDTLLTELETAHALPEQVGVVAQVETAASVWCLRETLAAAPRIVAAIAATHDALDLPGRTDARSTWTALRPPALPDPAHLQERIADAATQAGVPLYAALATDVAPGQLTDALGPDAQQHLADAAAAARAHGCLGALTLHPEVVGVCNAAFPGSLPPPAPAQAVPPPPASPPTASPWQPVVPSHFGIGVPPRQPDAPTTEES